jgi:SPP1 family predicted phage head-tail adaptor
MFKDTAELMTYTTTPGPLGQTIKTPVYRGVYCDAKSVQSQEFYAAATADHKPELVLEMRRVDYNKEKQVRHNGTTYEVIRTFTSKKNAEFVELVCEVVVGHG